MQYKINDHGIDHSQYFPGAGRGGFDHCVVGSGSCAQEAYASAVDQIYETFSQEKADRLGLPETPEGLSEDVVPGDAHEEMYYYVSIQFDI